MPTSKSEQRAGNVSFLVRSADLSFCSDRAVVLNRGAICDSLGCRELLHIIYLSRKKVECCDVILRYKLQFILIEK